jgi:hypothetical protein
MLPTLVRLYVVENSPRITRTYAQNLPMATEEYRYETLLRHSIIVSGGMEIVKQMFQNKYMNWL